MKKGKVILAGGGPGDPGLMTLAALDALREADVIVYDWLVNPLLLEGAPQAEKIFVGKKGGTSYIQQDKINRMLLQWARKGKNVVRLKGGDPFIFGRGGEEALFLKKHRIPFEIIPGVSAGIGAPAYAGIPLTDRRFASQVMFVTGHEQECRGGSRVRPRAGTRPAPTPKIDWKKLAQTGGTLVSFMGVKTLPDAVRGLLQGGKSPRTPVAVIEWGTLPHQRVVEGTLKDIVQKCRKAKIDSPALTVIGDVVNLRKKLSWFEKKPLAGKTVVVTRARAQASELVRQLAEKGASVVEFPTIEILPPAEPEKIDREIKNISSYDWIVFTSSNGIRFFFGRLQFLGKDARLFAGRKIAVIGDKTAEALLEKGVKADLVPGEFTSASLFETLKNKNEIRGKKFLLARADIAPPDFKGALEKAGAEVTEIKVYRTSRRPTFCHPTRKKSNDINVGWQKVERLLHCDYVTFTSSSTVKNFFASLPSGLLKKMKARFVTIGPVTTQTLKEHGFKPYREAKVHTIEGLVEAITNGGSGR